MANSDTKTQPWPRTGLFLFNSRVVDYTETGPKRACGKWDHIERIGNPEAKTDRRSNVISTEKSALRQDSGRQQLACPMRVYRS